MNKILPLLSLTALITLSSCNRNESVTPVTTTTTTSTTIPSDTTTSRAPKTTTTTKKMMSRATEKLILKIFYERYPASISPDEDIVIEFIHTICPALEEGSTVKQLIEEIAASDGSDNAQQQMGFLMGVTIGAECPIYSGQIDDLEDIDTSS